MNTNEQHTFHQDHALPVWLCCRRRNTFVFVASVEPVYTEVNETVMVEGKSRGMTCIDARGGQVPQLRLVCHCPMRYADPLCSRDTEICTNPQCLCRRTAARSDVSGQFQAQHNVLLTCALTHRRADMKFAKYMVLPKSSRD